MCIIISNVVIKDFMSQCTIHIIKFDMIVFLTFLKFQALDVTLVYPTYSTIMCVCSKTRYVPINQITSI